MDKRTKSDIIKDAKATLETAEFGLRDLINGPSNRKLSGLRNLVVFGRAVTNILQNLRSTVPQFEEWYKRYREEMESDPLLKYFYNLRSVILKEGVVQTKVEVQLKRLEFPADLDRIGPPQSLRNISKSYSLAFNGFGNYYWEVEFHDGSKTKYYLDLPTDIGSASRYFPNPPKKHLGKKLYDNSIEKLSTLYIEYLRKMVLEAEKKV